MSKETKASQPASEKKKTKLAPVKQIHKRENAWNQLSKAEHRAIEEYCRKYMKYLTASKTERKAYDEAEKLLKAQGFKELKSFKALKSGDKVYRGYHGKTMFASVIGRKPIAAGLHVVGGHTDAPRIDLKPVPLATSGDIAYFDTHYYGGIKKYQWVAHPLALHGTVVKPDGSKINICIGEDPKDPVFMISDLLPHLGAEQMGKTLRDAFQGDILDLVVSTTPCPEEWDDDEVKDKTKLHVLRLLEQKYGVTEQDLISAELEIVPAGPAREMGLDRSMILGYGHDDRICAYAGLQALLDLDGTPEFTSVVLLCDKEEIGSAGASGMDSTFFENSIAELLCRQEKAYSDLALRRCLESSRMLSADVCAAHDPSYPNVSSPGNMPILNAGLAVMKYTGSGGKGGTSDASAEFMAEIRRIFNDAGVIWQVGELGKVDIGGGGTIAKFLAYYGLDVVDVGVPLLNMHAPWEAATKLDTYMAYKGYRAFFLDKRQK
jgi:aspartyl aminopeptidase